MPRTQKAGNWFGLTVSLAGVVGRLPQWFLGCVLFSLGIKCFIDSRLGIDPLHAMIIGIVNKINIPYVKIGVIELIIVATSLIVWCLWNKKFPVVTVASVFFTMVIVGFLIDL